MTLDEAPDVMRVTEVAEILGVNIKTVYSEIGKTNLTAVHIGSSIRVTRHALLEYLGVPSDEGSPAPKLRLLPGGTDEDP